MSKCKYCGRIAKDDMAFCPACGKIYKDSPLKRDSRRTLWILSAVSQFLCILMFLLPTVRVVVSIPEDTLAQIPYLSYFVTDKNKEDAQSVGTADEAFPALDDDGMTDVLEGDFRLMSFVDFFGTEAYQTILLAAALVALWLFLKPLFGRRRLDPRWALWMLLAQAAFFFGNLITLLTLKDEPFSTIRSFADMLTVVDLPDAIVEMLCDMVAKFYHYSFNLWGWLYMAFGAVSLLLLVKLVFDSRRELFVSRTRIKK